MVKNFVTIMHFVQFYVYIYVSYVLVRVHIVEVEKTLESHDFKYAKL